MIIRIGKISQLIPHFEHVPEQVRFTVPSAAFIVNLIGFGFSVLVKNNKIAAI